MRLIDADALLEKMKKTDRYFNIVFDIEDAPTIETIPTELALEAGKRGEEVRFRIGGRLFAVRELPQ